ncbi:MAG: hypothetical protein R3B09_24375 [Nannocystaceae bacterium]
MPNHRPIPLALALAGLLACQPTPNPTPAPTPPPAATTGPTAASDDTPLLRTYAVPQEQSRAIESALRDALRTGNELPPLGTVERLPDGRLVVVAPAGVQEGVAALLRDLDPEKAAPVRTAELQYWIVVGEPSAEAEGVDAVPDIAPALRAVVESQGPMKFRLFEQMRLSSLLDDRAEAEGARMEAKQFVTEVGGRLVADLNLKVATLDREPGALNSLCAHNRCKELRSRVHLDPGQLLIVGQSSVLFDAKAGADARASTLFYVVRGQIRSGGA